jgi:hypothetical protein
VRASGVLERLSAMGVAAQASVPAAYAWAVTVAPAAWSHGATALAKAAAGVALLAVVAGIVGERRWGVRARYAAFWGFVLASALTWSAAPASLGPLRIDAPRGVAGMLGWALFALASSAPALDVQDDRNAALDPALPARRSLSRGDALYVGGGVVIAALLQLAGWAVMGPERALLVRIVSIAAGIAVIGAATDLGLARHMPRPREARARRLRRGMAALVALALLSLSGLLFAFRD